MAIKTEGKSQEMEILHLILVNGLFLIGKLAGGNKLLKPRIYTPLNDGRIHMGPLPGTPVFLDIRNCAGVAPIRPDRNKDIYGLYAQVTDPKVDPE